MTRKEAILKAIEILSINDNYTEIVNKLQELYDEMPLSSWTKASIIDCINEYIKDHDGFLPYGIQLSPKNGLPSKQAIYSKFNMSSINDFYKKYFPQYLKNTKDKSKYYLQDRDFFINQFKSEYIRIRDLLGVETVGIKDYNRNKENGCALAQTIIKWLKCKNYTDLLILCEFKSEANPTSITVEIEYDDKSSENELSDILKAVVKNQKYEA